MSMKTKYMSRKFIVAIAGLLVAIFGIGYGNNIAVIAGCLLAGSFIIGEAIVDAVASVKLHKSVTIDETTYRTVNEGTHNGNKE